MFSKLGDAMKDVAETLRRVYQDPPTREVPLRFAARRTPPFAALESRVQPGPDPFLPALGKQRLQPEAVPKGEPVALQTRLAGEGAWASWAAGAKVAVMAVFESSGAGRLEVPPLPRKAAVGTLAATGFQGRGRRAFEGIAQGRSRGVPAGFAEPSSRRGLDLMLALPQAISGEDLRTAPRPVQMRCSLQIVKATGENVRNLDLLGRYLIPTHGVRELRHDPGSGRLLVLLGPEAAGSGRSLLLIARRKDDRSLLTCFVEEP